MKYSEAEKKIKDLLEDSFGDNWGKFYKLDSSITFALGRRTKQSESFKVILMASRYKEGWLEVEDLARSEKALADIFMELALTPLEEREEEKKYVVKVWDRTYNSSIIVMDRTSGLLDISTTDAVDTLNRQADGPSYQVAFTKNEINRLKDIVTLNIDWDKAVEEYDGEI